MFVAGHLFGFGNRIWEYYISNINSSKDHSFVLVLLQNIFETVQGFGFAVMYGECNRRARCASCAVLVRFLKVNVGHCAVLSD